MLNVKQTGPVRLAESSAPCPTGELAAIKMSIVQTGVYQHKKVNYCRIAFIVYTQHTVVIAYVKIAVHATLNSVY